jgi:dTDP-4-dehydrorhamnose reductase
MRIYVIGSDGQVSRSLREAARHHDDVTMRCGQRPDVDLCDPTSIAMALTAFRPDVVVNPAAFTAVDRAESEECQAFRLNRDGAEAVALAAAEINVPVIHMSTDYVFDGKKTSPYVESDQTLPQSVYGHSKQQGEVAVAAANPQHVILRTSWVYAPFGNNFVRTMLRLATERDSLRVVDDQRGCPTYAPDIADAIIGIARTLTTTAETRAYYGVFHLAGADAMTWCDFARAVMAGSARRGGPSVPVAAIATSDYPTAAERPSNSQLSTAKLVSVFNVRMPAMETSLAKCLDRLIGPEGSLL